MRVEHRLEQIILYAETPVERQLLGRWFNDGNVRFGGATYAGHGDGPECANLTFHPRTAQQKRQRWWNGIRYRIKNTVRRWASLRLRLTYDE